MKKFTKFKTEIKKAVSLFWAHREALLAHHPDCKEFEDDCYHVGEKRLCVGCFTAYPIAIAILIFGALGIFPWSYDRLLLYGFIAGMVQLLSATRLTDIKPIKVITKIFLGIGIGFFTLGIFSIPIRLFYRLVIFFICLNITGLFSFVRMKKIRKICNSCDEEENWRGCPSFQEEDSTADKTDL
ncbi:MAG: hypothetical protein KGY76_03845 [Candidatus Thermoplasmatota archaeon]|nr:hypothetical protein [Candidatus Thermoplasmatota archaeon]